MKESTADHTLELQRTRQELRALLADDDESPDGDKFPRSATMRLLIGGLGHRLVWGAAGGMLRKTGSAVGAVSKLLPLSAMAKLLWGQARRSPRTSRH